jgi:oligoribonuclease
VSLDLPLVWIDLEMTGLDPETEQIVEIAVIVTDGRLERLEEGPDLVIHAPDDVLGRMAQVVAAMHADSGLTDAVRASALTVGQAQAAVLDFIRRLVPEPRRYMPALEAHLHYRNVDVSTLKELARRWYPGLLEQAPAKSGGHRALADIRESIAELRWYRERLFRPPA